MALNEHRSDDLLVRCVNIHRSDDLLVGVVNIHRPDDLLVRIVNTIPGSPDSGTPPEVEELGHCMLLDTDFSSDPGEVQ